MLGSHPDLSFAITYFGKFQNSYNETNFKHLENVLRYMNKTKDYCLCYLKDVIESYVDADFANETLDRKSVSGYFFRVFGDNASWKSMKQSCVILFSTEAEYVALASAATECLYVRNILTESLALPKIGIVIFEGNQSYIKICSTVETKRSKHNSVKLHFVKYLVLKTKILRLSYVETSDQLSDCLTKALPYCKLIKCIEGLGISKLADSVVCDNFG
ncbi:hypothetical protein PR048_013994 [Dryococelus australis]|uniref:Uncharacterized protein n=1 Tax=Dryococelus australis TaxID=614101 RepID=A0ABQ9HTS0_9NEOP|nr:hypothetical protein PR048_013994 [Dryococelus australis]